MLFNSYDFMLFFPVVLLLYFLVPAKYRRYILLVASYVFYMGWNVKYALLILCTTVITYAVGLVIGRCTQEQKRKKQLALAMSFVLNLAILFVFKYANFMLDSISSVIGLFGSEAALPRLNIMLPLGISFYTFQALGYTVDVYRGKIESEKSFVKYALFVSFFPKLVAGPIERSESFLKQIDDIENIKLFNYDRIMNGFTVMIWGFFLKTVIADRISILADFALSHDNIWSNGSTVLIIGVIAFSIQIYCDFASYSTIAIGSAEVMGFKLMENFNTPYFATSIKDFWSRWHISLSTWFKDYLYIPLGGNRKGTARKYFNLLIVFLVSGLWHGANWTFVIWGLIHAIYQIIGDLTAKKKMALLDKMNAKTSSVSYKLIRIFITFTLTNFAWIFFRAESVSDAFAIIGRIFTQFDPWQLLNGVIYNMGLDTREINILLVAVIVMVLVDLVKYLKNKRIDEFLNRQMLPFRWGVIIFLLVYIGVFGSYGPSFAAQDFIYFQF